MDDQDGEQQVDPNRDTLVGLASLFKELIEADVRAGSPLYQKIRGQNVPRS